MAENKRIIENALRKGEDLENENIQVSFEFIDWSNQYFFIAGLTPEHYEKFFQCLEQLRCAKVSEISRQNHSSLKPKSIFNNGSSLYSGFPQSIVDRISKKLLVQTNDKSFAEEEAKQIVKRAFEVRMGGTNWGRLHGFLWDSKFNLVWIDPGHNLYCNKAPKKYAEIATVKGFSPDATRDLQERLRELQGELAQLFDAWANGAASPESPPI